METTTSTMNEKSSKATKAKAARTSKVKKTTIKTESSKRPEDYIPQQGVKQVLTLADFDDNQLFAELRRRGFAGELRYSKVVIV